jgi:hypothetical protein
MEHRWGDRITVDHPVRISNGAVTGAGLLRNASVSGGFIETSLPLSGLVTVRVWIARGAGRGRTRREIAGFVVRREPTGFGLEWCELAALRPTDVAAAPAHEVLPRRKAATSRRLTAIPKEEFRARTYFPE